MNCKHRESMSHCTECCEEEHAEVFKHVQQLQSELSALKGENERLKEALRLFLRNRQWMIDVGATEGPLPQSLIENFAELQSEAVDSAKAALAKGDAAEGEVDGKSL